MRMALRRSSPTGVAPPTSRAISPAALADAAVIAVLGVVLALQNIGQTRFDTKLDLVTDPWGFLLRGLSAWDPTAGFGQLQNQAYGYLFPMGPFFGVLHSAGVPPWVQQWVWTWLLLAIAYLGVRLVATRLGLPWWAAVAGGLAYALAPRTVTVLGPLSAEVLAAALMPWMILPLLRSSVSLRRTAFLAALPVLFMGAANATLTISVLLVPAIWILLRSRSRWRLLGWWIAFIAAFCSWWVVPLLVQASYATPFLSFIESAQDTTVGLTPAEVIRGDVHWVAGIIDYGAPWWPAGYAVSASMVPVIFTFLLAGIGLAGLASRAMPERVTNAVLVLVGVAILTAGALAAPLHGLWWELLDGALAPFRNVHKFDPVLRFPLALGVAAACAALVPRPGQRGSGATRGLRNWATVGIGVVIVGVASPLVSPGVAAGTTWTQMPTWWREAADWMAEREASGRVLVVPGSGFGQYLWGRTIDEPLQPLSTLPWVVDNDLPLGSVGSARVLDSISSALAHGRESAGLADLLARSGIRFVLVRNDIDTGRTLAPARSVVAASLQRTPGLELRAAFGDVTLSGNELTAPDFGRDGDRPALEIYEVTGATPRIAATPVDDVAVMTGGPEGLLPALSAGLITPDTPVIFTDDSPPSPVSGLLIVSDSLLRRDRALARGNEAFSGVLSAREASRVKRRANDLVPFASPSFTVATYRGISAVTASSAQSYGDVLGPLRPERQPFAALDGSADTWWQSASVDGPVGQWWQADFPEATDLRGLSVIVVDSPLMGSPVTSVDIETDRGRLTQSVGEGGIVGPLTGPTLQDASYVRITAASATGDAGSFGIREVRLPGIEASQPLLTPMPPAAAGGQTAIQLVARQPLRYGCVLTDGETRCDPQAARSEGDAGVLDRLVSIREPIEGRLEMRGVIRPGPLAATLFDPLGAGVRADASSWLSQDPLVRPGSAIDDDTQTAWVADLGDPEPSMSLTWGLPRVIDGLSIRSRETGQAFAQPLSVRVTLAGRRFDAEVGRDGFVSIPNVLATSMNVEVTRWTPLSSIDTTTGQRIPMPVHIAEIEVPALDDLVYTPDLEASSGALCGLGPTLAIDGEVFETRVDASLRQILQGDDVRIIPCGSQGVSLAAGTHRITLTRSELADPLSVTVVPEGYAGPPDEPARGVETLAWGATERAVLIAPGPQSILRVAESANAGWTAELDGVPLAATRVDGWQQAWLVPAGNGGRIDMAFAPQARQSAGLIIGAVLIVMAVVVGMLPVRTRRTADARASVPWAVRHPYLPTGQAPLAPLAGGLVTAAWSVWVAGLLGLACAGVALLARRLRYGPTVVLGLLSTAGLSWALGWPDGVADTLALLGTALAVVSALTRRDA